MRSISSTVGEGGVGLSVLLPAVHKKDKMEAQNNISDLKA